MEKQRDKAAGPPRAAGQSSRPRASQRGGRRPTRQNQRGRQVLAVSALAVIIVAIVAYVVLSQGGQSSPSLTGALPGEENGHARGSATASVVVTEWSDFQ